MHDEQCTQKRRKKSVAHITAAENKKDRQAAKKLLQTTQCRSQFS